MAGEEGDGGVRAGAKEAAPLGEDFERFVLALVGPELAPRALESIRSCSQTHLAFTLGRSWELRNMAARLTANARVI